jgi:hypothetical protein
VLQNTAPVDGGELRPPGDERPPAGDRDAVDEEAGDLVLLGRREAGQRRLERGQAVAHGDPAVVARRQRGAAAVERVQLRLEARAGVDPGAVDVGQALVLGVQRGARGLDVGAATGSSSAGSPSARNWARTSAS